MADIYESDLRIWREAIKLSKVEASELAYAMARYAPAKLSKWANETRVPWTHILALQLKCGRRTVPIEITDALAAQDVNGFQKAEAK